MESLEAPGYLFPLINPMDNQVYRPIHFIEEPITVVHGKDQILEKKPTCPQSFEWRGQVYIINSLIAEWHDYQRRGRYARNMQPQHAAVAQGRGSWGVGKFYFRVLTDREQVFDIYYDRAPKNVDLRKGAWFVYQELANASG